MAERLKRMTGLLVLGAVCMMTGAAYAQPRESTPVRRPNVILIYTDDQGTVDAGCYGSDDLITPAIDGLAERGIRFTQMYAPSAICSASRAGTLTGRFPARAGVPGNVSSAKGHAGMPTSEVTIAEMMRDGGYVTGHVGKWHLGYTPETMPNGQGFASSFGHMGGCIDNYSHFFYWAGPNRHDLWRDGTEIWRDGEFFPDLIAAECIDFIEKNRQRPFFLYWAINVPHYPLQGTEKWRQRYRNLEAPRRMYGEFVSTMDERIGQVLDRLEELDLDERTIVIFQSDHGHSTEERTFGGGGSAGPYRGAKGCLFEGGIRVPSIISWPGTLAEGEVRHQMVTGCDWLPTLAELCGLQTPKVHLDGKSIRGVLESADAASPHETFYWLLGGGKNPQWVVRDGDWKLLGNPQDRSNKGKLTADDRLFLVNLAEDPAESRNVAGEHPEVLERLVKLREEYVESLREE
ncbi:Arylsulfatase precursor [Maioricimonas rarisocia]|uniref:Arylsulfatase n=1 Tax=Maioricimonas rarisocia TaxID=2528026 RepID=A0A517ZBW3_9PLAN|nr:sulfatase-like hydrolase/transferase [Maioricimonas rarisocia]QDU39983.1 Arylsulfatase precursor [Maioricimonas rarisocia]